MYYSNPFYDELGIASAEMTRAMQQRSDWRQLEHERRAADERPDAQEQDVDRGEGIRQDYLMRASHYATLM